MHWLEKKSVRRAILVLLILGGILSAAAGMKAGAGRSQDFQWSGAHMLAQHIDPWAVELSGDPDHMIQGVQHVNYLPLLYLIILPLGYLSAHTAQVLWVLCNVTFAVGSTLLASRFYGLSRELSLAAVCLMLMALPTRNNFGNGQQALFVLAMLALSLLTVRVTAARAAVAGVSYVKFNFAPPIFLYLLIYEGIGAALISVLPAVAGLLVAWAWLGFEHGVQGLIFLARAPLQISQRAYWPRGGDTNLMDVLEPILQRLHVPDTRWNMITLPIAVAITVWLFYKARGGSAQWRVALLGLAGFVLYKHHGYDATTLLFPLCFAVKRWRERSGQILLLLISYVWYGQKILLMRFNNEQLYVVGFCVLMMALIVLYRMREEPGLEPVLEPAPAD